MCTRTPVLVGGNGCCGWYMKTLRRHWFSESPLRPEALLNVPLFHCFLGLLRGWHDAFVRHCTKKKKGKKIPAPSSQHPSISCQARHLITRCWYERRNWYSWRFVACHFFQWECRHHSYTVEVERLQIKARPCGENMKVEEETIFLKAPIFCITWATRFYL